MVVRNIRWVRKAKPKYKVRRGRYMKKRRYKKRTYKKRKVHRKKSKSLGPLGLAKLQSRPRRFLLEDRAYGLHNPKSNTVAVYVPPMGDNSISTLDDRIMNGGLYSMKAVLESTGGLAALGTTFGQTGIKYHIYNWSKNFMIRNLEKDPVFVTCYLVTNVRLIFLEENAAAAFLNEQAQLVNDLVAGWDKYTLAGHITNAGVASTYIPFGPGGAAGGHNASAPLELTVKTPAASTDGTQDVVLTTTILNPSNSIGFKHKWKVLKKATRRLNAGDEWMLGYKIPARTYDPDAYNANNVVTNYNQNGDILARKGELRQLLIFTHGAMGYSAANVNIYGYMDTNLSCSSMEKCNVLPVTINSANQVINVTRDATVADLSGPSDFTVGVDA